MTKDAIPSSLLYGDIPAFSPCGGNVSFLGGEFEHGALFVGLEAVYFNRTLYHVRARLGKTDEYAILQARTWEGAVLEALDYIERKAQRILSLVTEVRQMQCGGAEGDLA